MWRTSSVTTVPISRYSDYLYSAFSASLVQELRLTGIDVTSSLWPIGLKCTRLRALSVGRAIPPQANSPDHYLPRSLSELELNIVDSAMIEAIAGSCPQLRRLSVKAGELTADDVDSFKALTSLVSLRLSKYLQARLTAHALQTDISQLTDDRCGHLCAALPNLHELMLDECKSLGNKSLQHVGRYCGRVRLLDVNNTRVDDTGMQSIATSLTRLEQLDVSHTKVTSKGASIICRNCRRLRALSAHPNVDQHIIAQLIRGP